MVARINVRLDRRKCVDGERAVEDGSQRFPGDAPAPNGRVEDEADLRKAVKSRLAHEPAVKFDDEILTLGGVGGNHCRHPVARFGYALVRKRGPEGHRIGVAEDLVKGGDVVLHCRAQQ